MAKDKDKSQSGKSKDEKKRKAEVAAGSQGAGSDDQPKMSRKEYEKELEKLQVELVKMQEWVKVTGAKVCVLFEGRDAAGKGGIIKRITEETGTQIDIEESMWAILGRKDG